jgi:hypothetical protein
MADLMGIQLWLSKNHPAMLKYAGKWVAVSSKGVVTSASSLDQLYEKLDDSQKSEFLLTRIPTKREAANFVV